MSIYSEFDVEFNGNSPMNRNDPQQVEIFGPAGLEKNVNKSIAEFSSVFAQSGVLGRETTFSLVEVLQRPIRNFNFKVFRANTPKRITHCERAWKTVTGNGV